MSMIKASNFFFLSGFPCHVLCNIAHNGNVTILTFADEREEEKQISVTVESNDGEFILDCPAFNFHSFDCHRSMILGYIRIIVKKAFPA